MRPVIVLRRIAEKEYDAAVARYENERKGLGTEFRAVIEQHFQRIAENPGLFPKVRGEVRRAVVLRRFPFVIHFVVEPKRIVILSVFHTRRDPGHLKNRQ
ncbi:MAG TPA: type II toxin-antitoxin system RelE/ParE family toxin [Verrucomicrobiae bacterium]|jgi:plasmid stabilization system protein ParE|nr:type II toxin-antitoxin system RelE/ParE family toxin [Verrucomicrobiae bacterium]